MERDHCVSITFLMKSKKTVAPDAWESAVALTNEFFKSDRRLARLQEGTATELPQEERRRRQSLLYGVARNIALIEWAIKQNVRRIPKGRLKALLLVAGFEILADVRENEGARAPQVVHHAVDRAKRLLSAPEARLVNAVLRRLRETFRSALVEEPASADDLARLYSHPKWLVERWICAFGWDRVRSLLAWSQEPAPDYLRLYVEPPEGVADGLIPTEWPGFVRIGAGGWPLAQELLASGRAYVQDPSTRLAPELLAPVAGENVLDLCASPGGKTLLLAARLGEGAGDRDLVALDRPGPRLRRLEENLSRYPWCRAVAYGGSLPEIVPGDLAARGLPEAYDAVLIDVPCSNSGVFRRRVEARWLLTETGLKELVGLQRRLLRAAAVFVRPGGRLVYSTCSIDEEENTAQVAAFLEAVEGRFVGENSRVHYPWETGHDGGAAFLMRRVR